MNFGNGIVEILTKSIREKSLNVISLPKFLLPEITAQLPGEVPERGVVERKPIVTTKLPKL